MTERDVIRRVGLGVHVVGLGMVVVALLTGDWALGISGVLVFVVGGVWATAMVVQAANEAQERKLFEQAQQRTAPFSARFDDDEQESS
jgi:membrane-bound ClpP family serine protease